MSKAVRGLFNIRIQQQPVDVCLFCTYRIAYPAMVETVVVGGRAVGYAHASCSRDVREFIRRLYKGRGSH